MTLVFSVLSTVGDGGRQCPAHSSTAQYQIKKDCSAQQKNHARNIGNIKYIVDILKFHVLYRIKFIAGAMIYLATNYSACDKIMASTGVIFNMCRLIKLQIVEFQFDEYYSCSIS